MSLWSTEALGEHTKVLSGFAFDSKRFNDEGAIPLVRIRDVVRGWSSTFYSGDYDERFLVADGDLLIGMDGEFKCARWRGGRALLNQRVCRISVTGNRLDEQYLAHFLPAALTWIEDRTPYATVKHLSAKSIRAIQIPLPPIEEQRRIAAVLDKAHELRANRQASLALLDSLNESIFLDMFGDPSQWADAARPLIELVDPDRPISYGILKPGPDVAAGVPYVRVVDMRLGGVDPSGVKRTSPEISHQYRRSLLRTGDLLLSIRGHVGRLAEVPPDLDGANITQDTARLAIKEAKPRFVLQYLRTTWAQRWMESNIKGAAVRGINLGDVKRLPVPVFGSDDQDEFVRRVRSAERTARAQRCSASALDDLFASLQQQAFAGQL